MDTLWSTQNVKATYCNVHLSHIKGAAHTPKPGHVSPGRRKRTNDKKMHGFLFWVVIRPTSETAPPETKDKSLCGKPLAIRQKYAPLQWWGGPKTAPPEPHERGRGAQKRKPICRASTLSSRCYLV